MMRGLRTSRALGPLTIVLISAFALVFAGAGTSASGPNVGWGGFGNTPNENRHSPLTLIDKSNVAGLGRVVTVDFHAIDSPVDSARVGHLDVPLGLAEAVGRFEARP